MKVAEIFREQKRRQTMGTQKAVAGPITNQCGYGTQIVVGGVGDIRRHQIGALYETADFQILLAGLVFARTNLVEAPQISAITKIVGERFNCSTRCFWQLRILFETWPL